MLSELFIQNLAVIEKTRIVFEPGLNVFTGETGAGKSIVIDAINAVLGQRTSREIVRHGATKATVTASFTKITSNVLSKLEKFGYEVEDDILVIEREISADGKSCARVQGRPIVVSNLREIGQELINIHGQHDNQILLAPEKHIDILDSYGDYTKLLQQYYDKYKSVVLIKRELKSILQNEEKKEERIKILNEEIDEITAANLTENEDTALSAKISQLKNSAKIISALEATYECINGEDNLNCMINCGNETIDLMQNITDVYEPADEISVRIDGLVAEFLEVASDIAKQIDNLVGDENSAEILELLQERMDEINKLCRKYGNTVQDVLVYLGNAQEELDNLTLSGKKIEELNAHGNEEYAKLLVLAEKLSAERFKAAKKFSASIKSELMFLDMPNVEFIVNLTPIKPSLKGSDSVEFLISTNIGEPPKSIAKIASGGELSRIMLAIKNTMVDKDMIQTLIFDEIDTGVSGHAAQKIGLKLSQAAQNRQVIAVTHSAQIAALANHHFFVSKKSDDKNTYTSVEKLDKNGRINEVARIMSTDKITDLMLENAKAMIEKK